MTPEAGGLGGQGGDCVSRTAETLIHLERNTVWLALRLCSHRGSLASQPGLLCSVLFFSSVFLFFHLVRKQRPGVLLQILSCSV